MDHIKLALNFSQKGDIETWVHTFLQDEGKNKPLSDGLKKQKRYWLGPIEIDFSKLDRIVGPEEGMEYPESIEGWNERVGKMSDDVAKGWIPAPLIVEYRNGILSLRDGNHRMAALQKSGVSKYWTIIWFNSEIDKSAYSA